MHLISWPGCWSPVSREVTELDLVAALEVLMEPGVLPPGGLIC